jgi:hypothetical protein
MDGLATADPPQAEANSKSLLPKSAADVQLSWPVDSVTGEELESLAKEVMAQPPEVIQRLRKFLGE